MADVEWTLKLAASASGNDIVIGTHYFVNGSFCLHSCLHVFRLRTMDIATCEAPPYKADEQELESGFVFDAKQLLVAIK